MRNGFEPKLLPLGPTYARPIITLDLTWCRTHVGVGSNGYRTQLGVENTLLGLAGRQGPMLLTPFGSVLGLEMSTRSNNVGSGHQSQTQGRWVLHPAGPKAILGPTPAGPNTQFGTAHDKTQSNFIYYCMYLIIYII
jgi:hypothetical protein